MKITKKLIHPDGRIVLNLLDYEQPEDDYRDLTWRPDRSRWEYDHSAGAPLIHRNPGGGWWVNSSWANDVGEIAQIRWPSRASLIAALRIAGLLDIAGPR